ncbi:MAG TPA: DUF3387 domain-containing protein, partial [Candidatus Atribacteria bacterium]|nr:DUF3387 domain-containing protein [Candidatus Atribacteria bacterium]
EYLVSQGVNPKIPPLPLLSDEFIKSMEKIKSSKSKSEELKFAIIEHIHKHYEEDPEFYERFSDRLKRLLEEYKENWDILATELERLREEMKKGREAEEVFGIDPKRGMPFFGLLKREIFGKISAGELKKEDIDFLIDLTKDIVGIIEKEVKSIDFWDNPTKQKRLKSHIILNLLLPKLKEKKEVFKRRNEIVQKLIELAYHIYGEKNHGN